MLSEIRSARSNPGEPPRRWFHSDRMDLFVWTLPNQKTVRFQLTYEALHEEKALTWDAEGGFTHDRIDSGISAGRHPGSPLLCYEPDVDIASLVDAFEEHSADIDPSVRAFVLAKLHNYHAPHDGRSPPPLTPRRRASELPAAIFIVGFFVVLIVLVSAISWYGV